MCVTNATRMSACRDGTTTHLKVISIFVILVTSVVRMSSLAILVEIFRGKPLYDKVVVVIKCFVVGVILSTSLVHVFPNAYAALVDCQWHRFTLGGTSPSQASSCSSVHS